MLTSCKNYMFWQESLKTMRELDEDTKELIDSVRVKCELDIAHIVASLADGSLSQVFPINKEESAEPELNPVGASSSREVGETYESNPLTS